MVKVNINSDGNTKHNIINEYIRNLAEYKTIDAISSYLDAITLIIKIIY